jgi:DNA modification methylase
MKLSKIKLNPTNPRIIKDDKFKKLVKSIEDFPEMMAKRPMVCVTDTDGKLYPLGGNMRLKALQELKYKEIPDTWVMLADEWSEEKRKEFAIKDNVSFGEFDWDTLANEWNVEEISEWGVDIPNFEIDEVLEAEEDDFDVPEGGIETDIVLGDLFEIGEHRLLCGDSTNSDDVAKLMNGQKADMVFTDPPYGYEYQSNMRTKSQKFDVLKNDDKILDFMPRIKEMCNGFVFVCTTWKVLDKWLPLFNKYYDLSNMIIWDKGGGGIGDLKHTFLTDYEIILCSNNGNKITGKRIGSVWNISKDNANDYVHATQKPIKLISTAIENTTKSNDIVLDLFLGSGSTMVAAHQLNRKCYGMEIDPKYCQVIVDRMKKLDPDLVIKKNGKIME